MRVSFDDICHIDAVPTAAFEIAVMQNVDGARAIIFGAVPDN